MEVSNPCPKCDFQFVGGTTEEGVSINQVANCERCDAEIFLLRSCPRCAALSPHEKCERCLQGDEPRKRVAGLLAVCAIALHEKVYYITGGKAIGTAEGGLRMYMCQSCGMPRPFTDDGCRCLKGTRYEGLTPTIIQECESCGELCVDPHAVDCPKCDGELELSETTLMQPFGTQEMLSGLADALINKSSDRGVFAAPAVGVSTQLRGQNFGAAELNALIAGPAEPTLALLAGVRQLMACHDEAQLESAMRRTAKLGLPEGQLWEWCKAITSQCENLVGLAEAMHGNLDADNSIKFEAAAPGEGVSTADTHMGPSAASAPVTVLVFFWDTALFVRSVVNTPGSLWNHVAHGYDVASSGLRTTVNVSMFLKFCGEECKATRGRVSGFYGDLVGPIAGIAVGAITTGLAGAAMKDLWPIANRFKAEKSHIEELLRMDPTLEAVMPHYMACRQKNLHRKIWVGSDALSGATDVGVNSWFLMSIVGGVAVMNPAGWVLVSLAIALLAGTIAVKIFRSRRSTKKYQSFMAKNPGTKWPPGVYTMGQYHAHVVAEHIFLCAVGHNQSPTHLKWAARWAAVFIGGKSYVHALQNAAQMGRDGIAGMLRDRTWQRRARSKTKAAAKKSGIAAPKARDDLAEALGDAQGNEIEQQTLL